MTEDSAPRAQDRAPRFRNPAAEPDSSPEKQSELKLNVGIGTIGTILSVGVTIIFILLLDELVLGIVFAVVAVVSLLITLRVAARLRAARGGGGGAHAA
jgi:hypothetical protein